MIAPSRRARRVVTANLVIAATFITALVAWDLVGHLPLPLGVAGHEGSTVIVGLNGLRLLRHAAWRRATRAAQTEPGGPAAAAPEPSRPCAATAPAGGPVARAHNGDSAPESIRRLERGAGQ